MKKDARLTLRLTSETKRTLEAVAKRRDRSVNWLAQNILDRWADREAARQQKRTLTTP